MGKGSRNKRLRKMKAIKRERCAVKDLKQLKGILENPENKDVDMSEICTVLGKKDIQNLSKEDVNKSDEESADVAVESGLMDADQQSSKNHSNSLTDELRHSPVRMNPRQARRHRAKLNRLHKKAKKNKKRN